MSRIADILRKSDEAVAGLATRRNGGPAPSRFNKASMHNPKDREEASYIVEKRLEKIEKGVLGGEYVKGISQAALQLARKAPIAYLEILSAIRGMGPFAKAFDVVPSAISGLQAYDLEKPAKLLYPVVSPLRNRIPRVGGVGMATNYRLVLAVDDNNVGVGVATGARGGVINQRTASVTQPYRTLGVENFVTFEAQTAAAGYEDLLALCVLQTMQALMIREEQIIIGGIGLPTEIINSSFTLGTCPTPTVVAATTGTGGTLVNATPYFVFCVAMSLDGCTRCLPLTQASLPSTISRTNADGTTTVFNGGFSIVSASGTATTASGGATNILTATVAAQPNVYGYLWFVSATNTFTSCHVVAATNQNTVVINTLGPSNYVGLADLNTNDRSANVFVPDGLWTQALGLNAAYFNPSSITSNSYYSGTSTMINQTSPYFSGNFLSLNGTALTSNGSTGVTQFDNFLQWAFDLYKFGPDTLYVSSDVQIAINNLVMTPSGGGSSLYRLVIAEDDDGNREGVKANQRVTQYYNPVNGTKMNIITHPYLTKGNALFYTESLPYELSNVGVLACIRATRDYYAQEWPLITRKYQYGVYSTELIECYFPPGFQAIMNIGSPATTGFSPSVTMPTQALPAGYL